MDRRSIFSVGILPLFLICLLIGGCGQREMEDVDPEDTTEVPDTTIPTDTTEPGDTMSGDGDTTMPHFASLQERPEASMQALMTGELKIVDNCLRVGESLVVWPYRSSLAREGGVVVVRDSTGRTIARVGEEVNLGGGQVAQLTGNLAQFAKQCRGPYWITGDVVKSGNAMK